MSRVLHAAIVIATSLAAGAPAAAVTRASLRRDVKAFAAASCLLGQSSTELQKQGDAWISIAVCRSEGELADWKPLQAAVTAEMARRPMYVAHRDGSVGEGDRPAEVAYCVELQDAPALRAAIAGMVRRLAAAQRRR